MNKRVAMVTGCGDKRLGWHVAESLAGAGFDLIVHYRRSAEAARGLVSAIESKSRRACAIQADVTDAASVARLFEQADSAFGRLDALVCCAAIWDKKPLEDVDADDVRRHFEVNVLGSFLCARAAGLRMARQPEGGAIVLIGDWAEARPYLGYSAYFASKGAIPTMARDLAVELGSRNPRVRVNAILPGPVLAPEGSSAAELEQRRRSTLVQLDGRPDFVTSTILHLIDNRFLTGVAVPVDGGRTIFAPEFG